jgi:hypothetical protein
MIVQVPAQQTANTIAALVAMYQTALASYEEANQRLERALGAATSQCQEVTHQRDQLLQKNEELRGMVEKTNVNA